MTRSSLLACVALAALLAASFAHMTMRRSRAENPAERHAPPMERAQDGSQTLTDQAGRALQRGEYEQAFKLAQQASRLDSNNQDAWRVLNLAGRAAAESAGAVPSAAGDQVIKDARIALDKGDDATAIALLSKGLQDNPRGNPRMLGFRALTYARLGRWEEAREDANAGLALAPDNMMLLNTKALAENKTNRYREALATAERMIELDSRNPWGYVNRAGARTGLGDRKEGLIDLEHAAALDGRMKLAADQAGLLIKRPCRRGFPLVY